MISKAAEHFDWPGTQVASRCSNMTQSFLPLLLKRKTSTKREVATLGVNGP
jgi:hypothetical protein